MLPKNRKERFYLAFGIAGIIIMLFLTFTFDIPLEYESLSDTAIFTMYILFWLVWIGGLLSEIAIKIIPKITNISEDVVIEKAYLYLSKSMTIGLFFSIPILYYWESVSLAFICAIIIMEVSNWLAKRLQKSKKPGVLINQNN